MILTLSFSFLFSVLIYFYNFFIGIFDWAQSWIIKVVPIPNWLVTLISPPIYLTIFLLIVRPRPVPCLFILECSSSLLNSKNNFSKFSFFIPIPESTISISKWIKGKIKFYSSPSWIYQAKIFLFHLFNFFNKLISNR